MRKKSFLGLALALISVFLLVGCKPAEETQKPEAVQNFITAVDAIGTCSLDSGPHLEAAYDHHGNLEDHHLDRDDVTAAKVILDAHQATYDNLVRAEQSIIDQFLAKVKGLPAIANLKQSDTLTVTEAKTLYGALHNTSVVKSDVIAAKATLDAAEAALKDLPTRDAAVQFIAAVNAFGAVKVTDKAAIEALVAKYNGFTSEVKNYEGVSAAKTKLDALVIELGVVLAKEEIKPFLAAVDAFDSITLDSGDAIEAAIAIHTALSAAAKDLPETKAALATLNGYKSDYEALVLDKEVKGFTVAVDDLDPITLDSGDAIEAAIAIHTALSASAKAHADVIAAKVVLDGYAQDYADMVLEKKVNDFSELVDLIGTVEYTPASLKLIEDAEKYLEANLSAIGDIEATEADRTTLTAARNRYAELKNIEDSKEFLEAVEAIGDTITLGSKDAIELAEGIYEDMLKVTQDLDAVVAAKATLDGYRNTYNGLTAQQFVDAVDAIETPITAFSSAAIDAAHDLYNALIAAALEKDGVAAAKAKLDGYDVDLEVVLFVAAVADLDPIGLDSGDAIDAAFAAHTALSDAAKAHDDVIAAKATLDTYPNVLKALIFIDMVDAIGTVEYTPASLKLIEDAEKYLADNLESIGALELIDTAKVTLTDARAAYKVLHDAAIEAAVQAEIADFISMVNEIPAVSEISLYDLSYVAAAETKFNALSDDAKNHSLTEPVKAVLNDARDKYDEVLSNHIWTTYATPFLTEVGKISATVTGSSQRNIVEAERLYANLDNAAKNNDDIKAAYATLTSARTALNALGLEKAITTFPGSIEFSGDNPPHVVFQAVGNLRDAVNEAYGGSYSGKANIWITFYLSSYNGDRTNYLTRIKLSDSNINAGSAIQSAIQAMVNANPTLYLTSTSQFKFSIYVEDLSGTKLDSDFYAFSSPRGYGNFVTASITNTVTAVNVVTGGENSVDVNALVKNTSAAVTFVLVGNNAALSINKYTGVVTIDRSKVTSNFNFTVAIRLGTANQNVATKEFNVVLGLSQDEIDVLTAEFNRLVSLVPAVGEITFSNGKDEIVAAETYLSTHGSFINNLPAIADAKVTLTDARAKYNEFVQEVTDFVNAVNNLPGVNSIVFANEAAIDAAYDLWDALATDQQESSNAVTAKATLDNRNNKLKDLMAAEFNRLVGLIPEIDAITLLHGNLITAAEEYLTLNEDRIDDLESIADAKTTLGAARTKYDELYDGEAATGANFVEKVSYLPEADDFTLSHVELLEAAEAALELIVGEGHNYDGVAEAKVKVAALRALVPGLIEAKIEAEATAFLGSVESIGEVTLSSGSKISAALTAYAALSEEALEYAGVDEAHEDLLVLWATFDEKVLTTKWTDFVTTGDTRGEPEFSNGVWSYTFLDRGNDWWVGTWALDVSWLPSRARNSKIYVVFRSVEGESYLIKGSNDFNNLGNQITVVSTGAIQIVELTIATNNVNLVKLEFFSKNGSNTGLFEVFSISNTATSAEVIAELNGFASSVSQVLAVDSFSEENEDLMSNVSASFGTLSFEARTLALGLNESLRDAIKNYNDAKVFAADFLLAVDGLPSVEDDDILDSEEGIKAAKIIFDKLSALALTKEGVQDAYDDFALLYDEFVRLVNLRDAALFLEAYNAIGEVTTASGEAITAALDAYDILSDGAKSVVNTEYQDLLDKEATYYALVFIAEVTAITVTTESEAAITAAYATYAALSEKSLLVVGVDVAYASLQDKEATYDSLVYIALVDAIGTVVLSEESLAKIVVAEEAYDVLSAAALEKEGVTDAHGDMVTARNSYNALKDASDVDAYVLLVNDIDETITESSEMGIIAAEDAWKELSANAKLLPAAVSAHDTMVAARTTFDALDRANMITDFINAVSAVDDTITLDSREGIDAAYAEYSELIAKYDDADEEADVISAKEELDGYLAEYQVLEFKGLVGLLPEDAENTLDEDSGIIDAALNYYGAMPEAAQNLVATEYAHLLDVKAYWDGHFATFAGYIAITDAAGFTAARNDTNNKYYLANDIIVTASGVWNSFLDGNGKTITASVNIISTMNGTIQNANLIFTTTSTQLITTIGSTGILQNCKIDLTVTNVNGTAVLAYTMNGTVNNCIITLTHIKGSNPGAEPIGVARVFYTTDGTVSNCNVLMVLNVTTNPALNNFAQYMRITCGATVPSANTHSTTGCNTYVTNASNLNYTAAKYPVANGWSADLWNFTNNQVPTLKVLK